MMGGENLRGISVRPKGRAGECVKTTSSNGGPLGSRATIALILEGRASARIHPSCPD